MIATQGTTRTGCKPRFISLNTRLLYTKELEPDLDHEIEPVVNHDL